MAYEAETLNPRPGPCEETSGFSRPIDTANKTWKYILIKATKINCLFSSLVRWGVRDARSAGPGAPLDLRSSGLELHVLPFRTEREASRLRQRVLLAPCS